MLSFLAAVVRLRPRVVHAHDAAVPLPGLLGARLTGASLVYDSHELASGVAYRRGLLARIVTTIERIGIRRAAAVITVSDSIADRLHSSYRLARRPVVLRNLCALRRPEDADPPGGVRTMIGIDGTTARPAPGRSRPVARVPGAHPGDGGGAGSSPRVPRDGGAGIPHMLAYTREADVGVTLFEPSRRRRDGARPGRAGSRRRPAGVTAAMGSSP
jgi:hypothetical protein